MRLAMVLLLLVPIGCGTSVASSEPGGAAEGDLCALAERGGTFTFRVRNVGTDDLQLHFGWGGDLPLRVETTEGWGTISRWAEPECGTTCEAIYAGASTACALGGPGVGEVLEPGAERIIEWDRRFYERVPIAAECIPEGVAARNGDCAAPYRVEPSPTRAELEFCRPTSDEPPTGWCENVPIREIIDIDLAADEAVFEIE